MNGSTHESLVSMASMERCGDLTARVSVAHVESVENHGGCSDHDECFDPASCCDAAERAMIEHLRQLLHPITAPEGLFDRVEAALDRCCLDEDPSFAQSRRAKPVDGSVE